MKASIRLLNLALFAFLVCLSGCTEEDAIIVNALSGGLVEPQSANVSYLVGDVTAAYTLRILVPQGDTKTTGVEIWAEFSNALGTGDAGLVTTFPVTHTVNSEFVSGSFSYQDLSAATRQADGSELPADDLGLAIGDGWTIKYVGITDVGSFENAAITNLKVSTRFGGNYSLIGFDYWRNVGAGPVDENGFDNLWLPEFTVEALDVSAYRMTGVALWADQEVFFDLDPDTDEITYPELEPGGDAQTVNDQPLTRCPDPVNLANVPCATSNTVIRDDVFFEDQVSLVFGYLSASGPREFYHLLEKIVE